MLPCFFVFLLAQGSLGEGAKDFGGNVLADCDDGSGLNSSIVRRGSEIACKKSRSLPLAFSRVPSYTCGRNSLLPCLSPS